MDVLVMQVHCFLTVMAGSRVISVRGMSTVASRSKQERRKV